MGAIDVPGRGEFEALLRRVRALETQSPLESSSVENGRVRFIGGLLRVDAGGRVEIVGTLLVDGETTVTGTFNVNGPWQIAGDGSITGAASITGDVTITGPLKVDGAWELNGTGEIVGATKLTGDLSVTGAGRVKVGAAMTLDPSTDGGAVTFTGGRRLSAGDGAIALLNGLNGLVVGSGAVTLLGVPNGTAEDVDYWLGMSSLGQLRRVPKGSGGPTGAGLFRWPFPLSSVSKEFDTTDPAYTPPGHRGIDFAQAGGTPIPAAGSGTVLVAGFDSERGNFVILDHGSRDGRAITSRYYHLQAPSPLRAGDAVSKGQMIGLVGTTGLSTGNHLHFELRYGGVAENPRAVMAVYGE